MELLDDKAAKQLVTLTGGQMPPALVGKLILTDLIKSLATGDNLGHKLALQQLYEISPSRLDLSKNTILQGSNMPAIVQTFGLPLTMALVALLIQNFCNQFNVKANMTVGQIQDLAADLVLDFKDRRGNQVRLEELAIFFDRAAKGEFRKKDGTAFIFDRIDRSVIEGMMDVYFENDRTQAIWAIEDDKRVQPAGAVLPRSTPPILLDKQGNDITPRNIYDLAGTPIVAHAKFMADMEKKYGDAGKNE